MAMRLIIRAVTISSMTNYEQVYKNLIYTLNGVIYKMVDYVICQ